MLGLRESSQRREAGRELLASGVQHASTEGDEVFDQLIGQRSQTAALFDHAADASFDQRLPQRRFGIFHAAPDIPITLAQLSRGLFDRAGLAHGEQDFANPPAEEVIVARLQPDFDSRPNLRR